MEILSEFHHSGSVTQLHLGNLEEHHKTITTIKQTGCASQGDTAKDAEQHKIKPDENVGVRWLILIVIKSCSSDAIRPLGLVDYVSAIWVAFNRMCRFMRPIQNGFVSSI